MLRREQAEGLSVRCAVKSPTRWEALGDIRVEPVDGGIVLEARDQAQLNKAKEIAEEILLPSGWTRFGLPGGV